MIGKQLCRRGLEGPAGQQFDMNKCVLVAKTTDSLLGCQRRSTDEGLREVILPLYPACWDPISSAESVSGLLSTRDMDAPK